MADYILEPQTITLDWKISNVWKEEIKALPATETFDCVDNRIRHWIKNDPQFAMNNDCQKHALEMLLAGLVDYMQAT